MKTNLNRRDFLKLSGMSALSAALARSGLSAFAQDASTLQLWHHFSPLATLIEDVWGAYLAESHPGISVEYSVFSPPDLGPAVQLAYPSGQAPDIHTLTGFDSGRPVLMSEGWFTPLEGNVPEGWIESLPPEAFIEGNTTYQGTLFSFPLFSFRWNNTGNWFNKQLMEDAGYDPENGPETWDEFRDAARKITESGGGTTFGWIQGHNHIDRNAATLVELAQIAGAPGEIDWHTGAYVHASEPFLNAMEFMLSMVQDGSLFPGSSTLDTRNARARWVTGVAGQFFDGPWNPGVVNDNFPEFMESMGIGQTPVLEAGQTPIHRRGPAAGEFFISSQAQDPAICGELLSLFTGEDFQRALAERMDQPPINLEATASADVHPIWAKGVELMAAVTLLEPVPAVRNAAVSEALARMPEVRPNLGEIVQGVITEDISDYASILKNYQDQLSAARDRAIQDAQAAGFEVSLDDWVFPNWDPNADYTAEFYASL
jgi:multiple sugar transport system substrate-binding protein